MRVFNCKQCNHSETGNADHWYGYVIGTVGFEHRGYPCGICGNPIFKEFERTKKPFEIANVECNACKQTKAYKVKWYLHISHFDNDPYFGLNLYYWKNVKDDVLWVYNHEHLVYLREYLNSKIRDKVSTGQYTMVAKLPKFIKSAKNRDKITKYLDQMEKDMLNKKIIECRI